MASRLVLDVEGHKVTAAGAEVPLSTKEFGLLHLLLRHLGKTVRRERLLQEVWGADYFGDIRLPVCCTSFETNVLPLAPDLETAYWAHLRQGTVLRVRRCAWPSCRREMGRPMPSTVALMPYSAGSDPRGALHKPL